LHKQRKNSDTQEMEENVLKSQWLMVLNMMDARLLLHLMEKLTKKNGVKLILLKAVLLDGDIVIFSSILIS